MEWVWVLNDKMSPAMDRIDRNMGGVRKTIGKVEQRTQRAMGSMAPALL